MVKRIDRAKGKNLAGADMLLEKAGVDPELSPSVESSVLKTLSKSKDSDHYKKQQFYCERELLAWVLALKADPNYGDLSDVINQAIREYKARVEAD